MVLLNLRTRLACNQIVVFVKKEVAHVGAERRCRVERSNNDYFRMGAVIAVGELYDMAALGSFLKDDQEVKSYLESFGVRGLDDVDELGIKGPYRRDFERLYMGRAATD